MTLNELINQLVYLQAKYGGSTVTAKSPRFEKARRILDVSVENDVVILGIHTNSGNPEDVAKLENAQAEVAIG